MITTSVPAQVTTVEDKVVGELGIKQLLLLVTPVFGSSLLYVGLPPFFASAPYKVIIIVSLFAVFSTLAVRIKSKIVLEWLLILVSYYFRPRLYLFNKNDTFMRDMLKPEMMLSPTKQPKTIKPKTVLPPRLNVADLVQMEQLMADPRAKLHFKTDKKGALSVHITEV